MERLNYHHLYLFWLVAQEGQFSRAAARLRIAQSAVTFQIKQLEEHLGRSLIDRSNKRTMVLTEDGVIVFDYANSIFETGSELLQWTKGNREARKQTVRFGAISGLSRNLQYEFLKPLLHRPLTNFEMTSGDQDKLVKLLREHSLDLILSSHPVVPEGKVNFHSHILLSSPVVFVCSKKVRGRDRELQEILKQTPLYLPGKSFEARAELDAYIERFKVPPKIAGLIDDIALLRLFAVQSGAVVAMPQMGVQNEIDSGEVVIIEKAGRIEQRFYAITREKRVRNQLISELIESIKK